MTRRSHSFAVAVAALAAAAASVLPANATTTVVSYSGVPAPLAAFDTACDMTVTPAGTGTGSMRHVRGPATPPAGSGSLELHTGASSTMVGASETFSGGVQSTHLGLHLQHYEPATGGAQPFALLVVDRNGDGNATDVLSTTFAGTADSWQLVNAFDSTHNYTVTGPQPGLPPGPVSWQMYETANQSSRVDALYVGEERCSAGASDLVGYLDDLQISVDSVPTAYDFEAIATSVTNTVSKSALVYGSSVTVRTTLHGGGSALAGKDVRLLAHKAGTVGYTQVADLPTNSNGVASSTQTPRVNTTYKWVFNATGDYAASTSTTKPVGVARKLTIAVSDTTLAATQSLKVHGRETPSKPGSTVTVWRHNRSGTFKVGSTTVKSDGTWALGHAFPKGKWSVYATAPKDATHIASKSPAVTVSSA